MPELGITLAMAAIYDGVEFPVSPRLVVITEETPGEPGIRT
jgi:hypothetical protein